MSTQPHTPEPWGNLNGKLCIFDDLEDGGFEEWLANRKRGIACVDACTGMTDPEKEISTLREQARALNAVALQEELAALRGQKEALLEALKKARKEIETMAQNGTELIEFHSKRRIDPWEQTAAISIRAAGIDEAITKAERPTHE